MSDFILAGVILVLLIYIVYQDRLNRGERERMQLKLMSKDVNEYKEAVEPPAKDVVEKTNPHVSIEDVPLDRLLSAEDNL